MLKQGPPQGLGDILGLNVTADEPRHHGLVGEEDLHINHHYPDIVAVPSQLAKGLGHRVACEPAAHEEYPVGEPHIRSTLPRIFLGLWLSTYEPSQAFHDNNPANYCEISLKQLVNNDL